MQGGPTIPFGSSEISGTVEGDTLKWSSQVTSPMPITLEFDGKLDGGNIAGSVKLGAFGSSSFSGTPA